MIKAGRFEKWAIGFLAIVCVLAVSNLVLRSRGRTGVARSAARAATPVATSSAQPAWVRSVGELARFDPAVRLDLLKSLQSRALPGIGRNPFEFEAPPAAVLGVQTQSTVPSATAPAAPPPLPLKPLGYSEKTRGVREAVISDDEQIYIVHEGDFFAKRFRVLKITPKLVEIEDEKTRQTVQLPMAP